MSIKINLSKIKDQISTAENASNREKDSVKLVAVSKFHKIEEIEEAINEGQKIFGENRVQEAVEKFSILKTKYSDIQLHIIGQLQTNKVKKAVEIADYIQSVDRIELLYEIEKHCSKLNKNINILFEIHTGEDSKSGYTNKDDLLKSLELCKSGAFPHISPKGFMTMAPFTDNVDLIRKSFISLRELRAELQKEYPMFELSELSMGMSGDFETAIHEGATMVRIGTAIFGERNYIK